MTDAKSFVVQAKTYFGLLPGQTLRGFSAEIKALTHEDKVELAGLLTAAGHPTIIPVQK